MAQAGPTAYDPARYWNERLGRDFSLAGAGHAGAGLAFNRWAYKVRRKVLLRALREERLCVAGARILELGFGTGFYVELWRASGAAAVTGFDIADVAVQAARARYAALGWRFERADVGTPLELGEERGQHDLATAFDVLFHLVDDRSWQGALDNLAAALKPGGCALITDKFQKKESGARHVRRRTFQQYREALAARDLSIRSVRPVFIFMNSPTDTSALSKVFWKGCWSLVKLPYRVGRALGLGDLLGGAAGAALYLPELALGRILRTGPSTKLLVAQKT